MLGVAVHFEKSGTVTDCNFTNNKGSDSTTFGGAVCMDSGSVTNCNFVNNYAYYGGAVNFINEGVIVNCNFTDNTAISGGAVYFATLGTVSDCNFINNTVMDDGGAIYMKSGSIENCNFTLNSADWGGAFHSAENSNIKFMSCNFINNSAKNGGGAVYFIDSGNVSDCYFANNSADWGGAVRIYSGLLAGCYFVINSASNGSAVYLDDGNLINCNFTNNIASGDGGSVYFESTGTVENCNFANNSATDVNSWGGAVYFEEEGALINCNFTNNQATGEESRGGAIYFAGSGSAINCNFINNAAVEWGGAILFVSNGNVENCNFTGNNATAGSAIYFYSTQATKNVSNSIFLNNRANANELIVTKNENNITITFIGQNNLLNAIYSTNDAELTFTNVTFTNVTYWGAYGITNTGSSTTNPSRLNKEAGQNITVGVVVNDELVLNEVKVTDDNGTIVLDITAGENYFICVHHIEDSYYTEAEKTVSNMTFYVNVTSQATTNKMVNITAKSNIYSKVMLGKLLFILPDNVEINATYGGNGTWWAVHTFDDYGDYQVNASYTGLTNVSITNATVTISKIKTELTASEITTTYNINKDLVITLKDSEGTVLSGVSIVVDLNGAKTYTTDNNGQVKVSTKGLAPKVYTAKITFNGDSKYAKSTKDVQVNVKKATPKLTAKKKTFKTTTKTKKYTITLKSNTGNAIKKAKVTLKVKGKTYKTTTNSKGKATFKITKLNKKGTFKTTVSYKGNNYYNKITKKVYIKVK